MTDQDGPQLPDIEEFGRPAWAYEHFPNGDGFIHLNALLFGELRELLARMRYDGDQHITSERLEELAKVYQLPGNIYFWVSQSAPGQNVQSFSEWYDDWQAKTFEQYYKASRDNENSHR